MAQKQRVGRQLVTGLEDAWTAIQRRNPDVPDAVLIVGSSSISARRSTVLGHFAGERWVAREDQTKVPEVFISGEGLAEGIAELFDTLLHEAAHGVAAKRGIADTSRRGQYHNKRFKEIAEELGLHVSYNNRSGWADTSLPELTAARYRKEMEALDAAIVATRTREGGPAAEDDKPTRTVPPAECSCGRKIRVAPSVLALAPILCGRCGDEFRTDA